VDLSTTTNLSHTLKNQSTAMKSTGAKRNVCPGSCVSTGAKFPVALVESAPMFAIEKPFMCISGHFEQIKID